MLCIDPKSGAVDFTFPWRGKRYESVNASSPLVVDNKVFLSECYGRGGVLLEMALDNQKLTAREVWKSDKLCTHFMTALYLDGYLYGCDGHGLPIARWSALISKQAMKNGEKSPISRKQ